MSGFIHIAKLRRIESEIQQDIYRVDRLEPVTESEVDVFLAKLDVWKNTIPLYPQAMQSADDVVFDGGDSFVSLLLVMLPRLSCSRKSVCVDSFWKLDSCFIITRPFDFSSIPY